MSSPLEGFVPKSFLALREYSLQKFVADLIAGLTVGLVALPLAMAFAISSGVPPQAGLYCAVVAGFTISALGGSMTQIGGPTGAFVVVVSGIVAKHGIDGLYMCTLMAGVMLALLGLTGLGTAVKFIPRPVVIGFTNGIAILIASTEIKDFFGLQVDKVPGDFLGRMEALFGAASTYTPAATLLAVGSLALILLISKLSKKIPGAIVALVVGTVVAIALKLPIETIDSKFGGIPSGVPKIVLPTFRADLVLALLSPAVTVAMLGAIESLLSAVVSDRMSGDKHNPNVELFGQGIANILSPLFGGLPATGAIARTATNIRSGAKTPVSGMIHAATLLMILLFAAPLAKQIPLAVLAAILMVVSYNMGEWSQIRAILRHGKQDIAVWLITFGLTVFADLTVAVEAGMILAALVYIRNVTNTTTVSEITDEYIEAGQKHSLQDKYVPEGVTLFAIHGPFLFGATDKLDPIIEKLDSLPQVVILRMRNVTTIDATGLHAIEQLATKLQASGRTLLVCGLRNQPKALVVKSGFSRRVGAQNVCDNFDKALARAEQLTG